MKIEDALLSIGCSIIAGLIFWFFVSYLPERSRKQKVWGGVLNDLYELRGILFGYFQMIVQEKKVDHLNHFEEKIQNLTLSKEDLKICLANKTVYDMALAYAGKTVEKMQRIGADLNKKSEEASDIINRIYPFNFYIDAESIFLLRDIRKKLFTYYEHFNSSSPLSGNNNFIVVDPSMRNLSSHFFNLYEDFLKLQHLIFSHNVKSRDFLLHKCRWLFANKKYKETIKACKKLVALNSGDNFTADALIIQSHINLGQIKTAKKMLAQFLNECNQLLGYRKFISTMLQDKHMTELVSSSLTHDTLSQIKTTLEQEEVIKNRHLDSNTELNKFLEARLSEHRGM